MNELTEEQKNIALNVVYAAIDFMDENQPIEELLDILMEVYDWAFQHFPDVEYITETHIVDAIEIQNIAMNLELDRVDKRNVFQIAFGIRNRLCL